MSTPKIQTKRIPLTDKRVTRSPRSTRAYDRQQTKEDEDDEDDEFEKVSTIINIDKHELESKPVYARLTKRASSMAGNIHGFLHTSLSQKARRAYY